jgi:NAD(P)-dependent dehydrogenase (short-subunit alcohol dehydrogenase family)
MDVIVPLCDEHVFTINLDEQCSDSFICDTYTVLKKIKQLTPKSLLKFVKTIGRPIVFKYLIMYVPYTVWIRWFTHCNILKYYWSTELIKKIIDANIFAIKLCILNKKNLEHFVINMYNQYDRFFNYTEHVFKKRIQYIRNECNNHGINIGDYYGERQLLFFLGINQNFAHNSIHDDVKNVTIHLYPLRKSKLNLDNQYVAYVNDAIVIKSHYFNLVVHTRVYTENDMLWIHGCCINILDDMLPKLIVGAEVYQMFNNINNVKEHFNKEETYMYDIVGIRNTLTISHQFCGLKHSFPICYTCGKKYVKHEILAYYAHCIDCTVKRRAYANIKANLNGFTGFITGARTKTGFVLALKILRSGGKVIGTTRYINFALHNYASEYDYNEWKHNLTLIRCDFTNISSMHKLLTKLKTYQINAIFNNAFRSILPSEYYQNTVEQIESELNTSLHLEQLEHNVSNKLIKYEQHDMYGDLSTLNVQHVISYKPSIEFNQFKDVKDVVHENSWDKKLEEVTPEEIVASVAVNQLVPTLIISTLKPYLIKPKFIINVSSYEGQFNTKKNGRHVHSNMCKTAMDMLIRSMVDDEDKDLRVFSINPGYVSGICPQNDLYPIPLDDAATQLCYPILMHYMGIPLDRTIVRIKNYVKDEW